MREKQVEIWFNYEEKIKPITVGHHETVKPLLPIINENNKIGTQLSKGFRQILQSDNFLKDHQLIAAYKNPKNLHQYLVRAKLNKQTIENDRQVGFLNCNSIRFLTCKLHSISTNVFQSTIYKRNFLLRDLMSCNSFNIVYLITCRVCQIQYVGETKRTLAQRLTDHRSNITTQKKTPISLHFNLIGHSLNDLQAIAIEKIDDRAAAAHVTRRLREQF